MGFISDLLGDITEGLIPDEITSVYQTPLPTITAPDVSFQPFTVASSVGGVTGGPSGTTLTLSPEQLAMQQQLFGGAGDFYTQASLPTAQREADIYQRLSATQAPEEERQRLALEERLAQQGRLGVRTNMFGGTPEAFAMEKAQAEARNQAMLGAMQQAQAEQAQQAALGGQYLQQSYAPQAALLSALSPAINIAGMADVARRQQGELGLEASIANLQGALGQQTGLANLYGGVYGGLLSGLGGLVQPFASSAASGLFDFVTGLFTPRPDDSGSGGGSGSLPPGV